MAQANEKQALLDWEEYVSNIRKSTAITKGETEEMQRKRKTRLEANPEDWFAYYFPKYCTALPADFHKRATMRVISNPEYYEVRIWSRELAKSTRTMMEVLYLMFVGHPQVQPDGSVTRLKKKYLLMCSSSADNAERLLKPYRANLQGNDKLIHDYGMQELPGSWTSLEFITRTGLAFRGLGVGQSPLGTRNEEIRPDIEVFDDIETEEDSRNPDQLKKTWRWIEDAAIPTRSISVPTIKIFCGNRRAIDGIVDKASKFAKNKKDLQIDIRDKNGKSTWPQKNTESMIDIMLDEKSYASSQREYYNNPIVEGSTFKNLVFKDMRPLRDYSFLVAYTDPSYKEHKRADYKATALVGKWQDEFHVLKMFCAQTTIANMVDWNYQVMDYVKNNACYYFMEAVLLQELFLNDFYKAGKGKNRMVPITGDTRAKPDKFQRIESLLEPLDRNGKLYFNIKEKDNPYMQSAIDQFKAFAQGSRAHDDAPDAVEGAVWIINNKAAGQEEIYIFDRLPSPMGF